MLKNICKLEVLVDNRSYQFLCDVDSPLNHIKEVLCEFIKYVGKIEDQVREQKEQKEQKDKEATDAAALELEQPKVE